MDSGALNEILSFIKQNGTALAVAIGALWLSRKGEWLWKREYDTGIAAERAIALMWKAQSEKFEARVDALIRLQEPSPRRDQP